MKSFITDPSKKVINIKIAKIYCWVIEAICNEGTTVKALFKLLKFDLKKYRVHINGDKAFQKQIIEEGDLVTFF